MKKPSAFSYLIIYTLPSTRFKLNDYEIVINSHPLCTIKKYVSIICKTHKKAFLPYFVRFFLCPKIILIFNARIQNILLISFYEASKIFVRNLNEEVWVQIFWHKRTLFYLKKSLTYNLSTIFRFDSNTNCS